MSWLILLGIISVCALIGAGIAWLMIEFCGWVDEQDNWDD